MDDASLVVAPGDGDLFDAVVGAFPFRDVLVDGDVTIDGDGAAIVWVGSTGPGVWMPRDASDESRFAVGSRGGCRRYAAGMHVQEAALNNARWCDLMCSAHGEAGSFRPWAWVHPGPVPPYHSRVVSLLDDEDRVRQELDAIECAASWSAKEWSVEAWSVKDSFGRMDLAGSGFEVLFEASWIGFEAVTPRSASGVSWSVVECASELEAWERCWSDWDGHERLQRRQFPPALLDEAEVWFLRGVVDGAIEHVAITNRTDGVAGVSNAFSPRGSFDWAGCVQAVRGCVGEVPLVGYERGDDLRAACASGFEVLGDLRVWEHVGMKES